MLARFPAMFAYMRSEFAALLGWVLAQQECARSALEHDVAWAGVRQSITAPALPEFAIEATIPARRA